MKEAVIVSAVRTAVGKAPKGTLRNTRPDELGAAAIKEAVARAGLDAVGDRGRDHGLRDARGRAGNERRADGDIAAGLPVETSRDDDQSFLLVGLADDRDGGRRIATGGAEVIVAGGLETMSMIPMGGNIIRPNPYLVDTIPTII